MSRLTNKQYLDRHYFLFALWHDSSNDLFGVLPSYMQHDVHRFYQASLSLGDEELIAHRQHATKNDSSLPHRASRGFVRIQKAYVEATKAAEESGGDNVAFRNALRPHLHGTAYPIGKNRIRIVGIARPEPDLRRIARALVAQARQELLAEREEAA